MSAYDNRALSEWVQMVDELNRERRFSAASCKRTLAVMLEKRDKIHLVYVAELERCAQEVLAKYPNTSSELNVWLWGCVTKRATAHYDSFVERWVLENTRMFRRSLRKLGLGAKVEVRKDGSVSITGAPLHTHPKYREFLGSNGISRVSFS